MADENQAPEPAQPKQRSFLLRVVVPAASVLLVMAIAALALFKFVVLPRLTGDSETDTGLEYDPIQIVAVPFDESYSALLMNDPDLPQSTLLYEVSFDCSNQITADLVTSHKAQFTNMLRRLHSNKKRDEVLDDPLLPETIQKQAVQEANSILIELQGNAIPENRIISVYHVQFYPSDI